MARRIAMTAMLVAAGFFALTESASARGRRGGCGSSCSSGGCGSGYSGGYGYSSCGSGGCGSGYSGGYGRPGCSTCGMTGAWQGPSCTSGHCSTGGAKHAMAPAGATLVVNLPADAKLTIDDHQTTSTTGTRVFATPPLEPGREFSYTLKAEVMKDGKAQMITQQVKVRAGEETRVTLDLSAATSVAGR